MSSPADPHPAVAARTWDTGLVLGALGVLLLAGLQRAPVAGLGMLLPELHLGPGLNAILTSAPAVCIAAAAIAVPTLHSRYGTRRLLAASAGLQLAGLALRALGPTPLLVAGSLIAYSGIAIAGITLPTHIHTHHPDHAARLTATMAACISAGVALTTTSGAGHGHTVLLLPLPLAAVAVLLWLRPHHGEPAERAPSPLSCTRALLRKPRTWALMVFFGFQSGLAVAMLSWEPALFQGAGLAPAHAGALVAVTMTVSILTALILGTATNRARTQTPGLVVMTLAGIAGLTGLRLAPASAPWLWAGLVGIGISVLSVALRLPSLHTTSPGDAIALGAIIQGGGYLIATLGPLSFALTSPATGITVLITAGSAQLLLAAVVGRPPHRPQAQPNRTPLR